jgi:hypothetical protein
MISDYMNLEPGFEYSIPVQEHNKCRGHQFHFDTRYHNNPLVELRVDFEVSTDKETWNYGGGFTNVGKSYPKNWGFAFFGHNDKNGSPDDVRLVRGVMKVSGILKTRYELIGTTSASYDELLIPTE